MTDFEILKEYINNQISKIDNQILRYKDEENEQRKTLEELSSITDTLENDIEKIDLEQLSSILNKFQTDREIEYDINKLKSALSLYKFLINPQIPNRGVKQEILNFLDDFKNKLKNYYNNHSINNGSGRHHKQKQLLEIQKQYTEYLTLISNDLSLNGFSLEKMKEFFDFLEKSTIDRKAVLNLIATFTKLNLDYYKKRVKIQEDIVEKKTDENARKLFDELKNSFLESELPQLEKEIKSQIIPLTLTEEEIEIKRQVEELINEHRSNILSKVDAVAAIQLFNDLTINNRKFLYLHGDNNIDWDFIVADYDINLKKYIFTNKEEVFAIFKFILQKNNDYLKVQDDKEEDKKTFLELREKIKLLLEESSSTLYDFTQLQQNVQNLYNMVYEQIRTGNLEEAKNIAPHLKIEEIAFVGNLRDMKEYLQMIDLEDEDINLANLEEIINDLKKYIDKYNEYKLEIEKNNAENQKVEELPSLNTVLDYDKTKNLILLLKGPGETFRPLDDISGENNKDKLAVKEYEFNKALQSFATNSLEKRKKVLLASQIVHSTSSSKERTIRETYGFDAERIRFSENGRTGYVLIPVHEENRKKLRSVYGEKIFENFGSIPMIIGVICCGASHDEYKEFVASIDHNKNYIRNIIEIFTNPNTDINVLTKIIEESMEMCKDYISRAQGTR